MEDAILKEVKVKVDHQAVKDVLAGEDVVIPERAKKDRKVVKKMSPSKPGRLSARKTAMRFRRIQIMVHKGMNVAQIADALGLKDKGAVYKIMKRDYFKEKEEDISKDAIGQAKEIFKLNLTAASTKVVHLMNHGDNKQKIQLDAAREILHQAGLKPVEVVENRGREYTPEELISARETVMEITEMTEKLGEKESPFVVEDKRVRKVAPGSPVAADAAIPLPTEEQVKQALGE